MSGLSVQSLLKGEKFYPAAMSEHFKLLKEREEIVAKEKFKDVPVNLEAVRNKFLHGECKIKNNI
jgi:hypothetical protein